MTFLAFDTSGERCVLALADEDGAVLAVSVFEGKRTLSRRLMGELDGLLTRSGLTLADLSAFAVGLGPGSFTGVRVGVTTAKTLAQVTGKPLVGVGTLDAYAAPWWAQDDTPIVPILPSRRGEVYAAVYRGGKQAEEPFAAPIEALTARLVEMSGIIVCGSPLLLPEWAGRSLSQPWTPPEGLARTAARRLLSGDTDDPLGLVPLYVVAPSISTPKVRPPAPTSGGARRVGVTLAPASSPAPPELGWGATMTPGRFLSFEAVAGDYDRTRVIPDTHLEEIARILARESRLERGGLFLDGGVGTGRFAAPLARQHPGQIIGADIAPAMMERIGAKASPGSLSLVQADLQRLPFRRGVFDGVLLVHILHLIEHWPVVLRETRRVLAPRGGVLLLGVEQGGRSVLVDFDHERARARRVLAASLGSGMAPALAHLRRVERAGGLGARVTLLETPGLAWKRVVPVARTLEALDGRTYSQMWNIPDEVHRELMDETRHHADLTFPKRDAAETLSSRFALYKAWWP